MLDALATGLATPLMYQIVFHSIPVVEFGFYTGIVTMIKSFGPAFWSYIRWGINALVDPGG